MLQELKGRVVGRLRQTEKYLKTDMVYLAKYGGIMTGSGFLSLLLSLFTAYCFANYFPVSDYGFFQYILSLTSLLGILALSGMKTAVSYSSARGLEGSLLEGIRAKMRWGLLSSLVAIILSIYYWSEGNILLSGALIIVAVFLPIWESPGLYVSYLQGKKLFGLSSLFEFIIQIVLTIALIVAIFLKANVLMLLSVFFLTWTLTRFYFLRKTLINAPPNDMKDPEMIGYSKHLTIMSAISSLAGSIDKILLWHFFGAAGVATYIFALTIPSKATGYMDTVNRLAFPKMVKQDPSVLQRTLFKKVFSFFLLALVFTGLYILIAPSLFRLFFPLYVEAIPYTVVAGGLIALQPFGLFGTYLTAQAKKKSLYLYNTVIPLVRIFFFIILIPKYHIFGAVFSLLIAGLAESLLLLFLFYCSSK